jgi:hypothetical protein
MCSFSLKNSTPKYFLLYSYYYIIIIIIILYYIIYLGSYIRIYLKTGTDIPQGLH